VFGLHFHFMFSFSENSFHFQVALYNSENMFGLTSSFLLSGNENTENAFGLNYFHN